MVTIRKERENKLMDEPDFEITRRIIHMWGKLARFMITGYTLMPPLSIIKAHERELLIHLEDVFPLVDRTANSNDQGAYLFCLSRINELQRDWLSIPLVNDGSLKFGLFERIASVSGGLINIQCVKFIIHQPKTPDGKVINDITVEFVEKQIGHLKKPNVYGGFFRPRVLNNNNTDKSLEKEACQFLSNFNPGAMIDWASLSNLSPQQAMLLEIAGFHM